MDRAAPASSAGNPPGGVGERRPGAAAEVRDAELLIVGFGEVAIDGVDALHRALRTWPAGQAARLTVIRRGGRIAVDIVPAWAAPAA